MSTSPIPVRHWPPVPVIEGYRPSWVYTPLIRGFSIDYPFIVCQYLNLTLLKLVALQATLVCNCLYPSLCLIESERPIHL